MRQALIILTMLLFSFSSSADELLINPQHPDRYIVMKGDTLWDISAKFLQNPWEWEKIWKKNPDIKNPDLIYPGDIISLSYQNGQPQLTLERGNNPNRSPAGIVSDSRLSPQIRMSPTQEAIPVIPMDSIKQFLSKPKVVTQAEIEEAPYAIGFADEHLIGGAGERIYVRSINDNSVFKFHVFRQGQPYVDPVTEEFLGFEAKYVGEANLQRTGDPATLFLTRSRLEVLVGDRLMPMPEEKILLNYQPHRPKEDIQGHIISVLDGVDQIGQYNVVVINKGTRDGLEAGHLFDIYETGMMVYDNVKSDGEEMVRLPDEKSGLLMVFRPFERVSYALVMYSRRSMHLLDRIKSLE